MCIAESSPSSTGAQAHNNDSSTTTVYPEHTSPSQPPHAEPKKHWRKWRFHLRPDDDEEPQDWWFCSTAIPLLAATTGPLANVMSIAALVTSWRDKYNPAFPGVDSKAVGFPDPKWCLGLNGASLACGFIGNIFLLFNFTRRVRYIVALPVTIILWYLATGILMTITISMNKHIPPQRPEQTYSQGFWHAVIAAVIYLVSSIILMLNMLGYFLGHYPQHFELSDDQRNLILQTMLFFIWLAGGAGMFAKMEGWSFVDSLYFCDVTVLTVGFGDFHPTEDVGRGLVFPYSVGGIIILGLMVSSIRSFARELGSRHVIRSHVEKQRSNTIRRTATTDIEFEQMRLYNQTRRRETDHPAISIPLDPHKQNGNLDVEKGETPPTRRVDVKHPKHNPVSAGMKRLRRAGTRKSKILMMREEKDRFDAMRKIQHDTHKFKRYSALAMSVIAFGVLWCVGAIGFWKAEAKTQGLSYFQSLYFCYVSLLTIGYGDLSPTSNAGKPFFIVWSLLAVPTMTILISDMGDTVIASFKRGTFTLADWTVLPKAGLWRHLLEKNPWLLLWLEKKSRETAEKRRLAHGMPTGPEGGDALAPPPTMEEVAALDNLDDAALARKLSIAIRHIADDMKNDPSRRYTYEEWAEYTRLIRFSRYSKEELGEEEEEEGLVEWDWIGENSPMLAEQSESEWLLDRLCESLQRYMRKHAPDTTACKSKDD